MGLRPVVSDHNRSAEVQMTTSFSASASRAWTAIVFGCLAISLLIWRLISLVEFMRVFEGKNVVYSLGSGVPPSLVVGFVFALVASSWLILVGVRMRRKTREPNQTSRDNARDVT
jgi:hypothetical protein